MEAVYIIEERKLPLKKWEFFSALENKGFPEVGTVWMAVSIPGFFAFGKSVRTGLRQKIAES